jgi:hypothetical protein
MFLSKYAVLIGALFLYQAWVTVMALRCTAYAPRHRLQQVLLIWLVPFVGAVIVRIALNAAKDRAPPRP